jgi:hypothetical protein
MDYVYRDHDSASYTCTRFIISSDGWVFAPTSDNQCLSLPPLSAYMRRADLVRVSWDAVLDRLDHLRVIRCPLEIALLGLNDQYNRALREIMVKG